MGVKINKTKSNTFQMEQQRYVVSVRNNKFLTTVSNHSVTQ